MSDFLDVIILVIEQPYPLFGFENRTDGQVAPIQVESLGIGCTLLW